MRLDESKCEHQTMSLFGKVTKAPSQPTKTSGKAEIYFDGGCLGNPGQKYGSFQVKLDDKEIIKRSRVDFGFGTNNEAEFNALKLALDESVGWPSGEGHRTKVIVFGCGNGLNHRQKPVGGEKRNL